MNAELPEALKRKAILEIAKDFRTLLPNTSQEDAEKAAETILRERIEKVLLMHRRSEEQYESATVKAHLDSLREGHRKEMQRDLRFQPGVDKETAKEILDVILGPKK